MFGRREQEMRNGAPVKGNPVCCAGSFIAASHSRRWFLDRERKQLGRVVWRLRHTSRPICSGQMWPGSRFANKSHLATVVIEMVVRRASRSFRSYLRVYRRWRTWNLLSSTGHQASSFPIMVDANLTSRRSICHSVATGD